MKKLNREDVISFLEKFMQKNKEKYKIVKIGVFGSISRNEVKENSDVDVVVILEKPDMFNLIGIKQELEEELSCPVDIIRLRKNMNEFLKKRIEKEAVYV